MDIDLRQKTATFRVLYRGPEGATKALNLRGLSSDEQGPAPLSVLRAEEDRVLSLPVEIEEERPLLGLTVRFQALSAPGRVHSAALDRLLLQAADAVVFLPDRADPTGSESLSDLASLVADLERSGRRPGDVPLFVQDYVDGDPRLQPRHLDPRAAAWAPRFMAVQGDTRSCVRTVFDAAREAIRNRVEQMQEQLGAAGARKELSSRFHPPLPVGLRSIRRPRSAWVVVLVALSLVAAAVGAVWLAVAL